MTTKLSAFLRLVSTFGRHQFLYNCGKITLTHRITIPLPEKTRYQTGERQQVDDPKDRASLPHNDFRIRRDRVGPLRWNRANRSVVDPQQQPLAGSVIAFADAGELVTGEWMKGMGYADKLRRSGGKACIPS